MKVIALEEHFLRPSIREANKDHPMAMLVDWMEANLGPSPSGVTWLDQITDLGDVRLAEMDAAGIDIQVLSHTVPGPEDLPPATGVRLAAEANDAMGDAIGAHPDRFAAFAALPMRDPEAAAKELERTVSTRRFVGAMINGHVGGRYLDDQFFWPVFEAAEALGVPIYLHPQRAPQGVVDTSYSGFSPAVTNALATAAWGWHIDTGLHCLRLIAAGVFDRFPGLQVIIGHMGEALPSMIWRSDVILNPISGLARPVRDYFNDNFYITTSGIFDYAPFAAALHAIGTDRIMFSVDYPYSRNAEGRSFFDHLPLSTSDREKIAHGNAERLLKLGGQRNLSRPRAKSGA